MPPFKCRACGCGGTDPRAKKHHAKCYCQRCYRKFMKLEKAGIISYEWRIEPCIKNISQRQDTGREDQVRPFVEGGQNTGPETMN